MAKVLRKYTTVPKSLYVERNADNQIKQIIEDMDRPGYVLVARQMGKTNLLLNAKRVLENDKTLIVYIDLSIVYTKERECYRNIIDSILESNDHIFNDLIPEIRLDREKEDIPPHREYFNELRKTIKFFKGKIVIILDEIDAIQTLDYSDKIFAQIRSMYFSRTTYSEFENLTYILSGVIEPSELIKDKNKSPFNIGEKIYLDDFTFEEHNKFIVKSNLNVTKDISIEIYNWAKGNPRLTFDICSEVESFVLKNTTIDKNNLKRIIEEKYLTLFDISPIDHIRTLLKSNSLVRNAVRKLNNGNRNISDEMKRKLYLYGIISSDYNFENLSIKNPIIEKSLTNEWLESIDKSKLSLLQLGIQKVNAREYDKGIQMLEEYLENSIDITPFNRSLVNYQIGFANFKNRSFEKALLSFEKAHFDKESPDSVQYYYARESLIGDLLYLRGDEKGAITKWDIVINDYQKGYPYRNALLKLAIHHFFKKEGNNKKSLALFLTLEEELVKDNEDIAPNEIRRLNCMVYYYTSRLYLRLNNTTGSYKYIEKAKKLRIKDYIPALLIHEYKISNDITLINKAKVHVVNSNLYLSTDQSDLLSFNKDILFEILILLYSNDHHGDFKELLDYSSVNILTEMSKWQVLLSISMFARNRQDKVSLNKQIINVVNIDDETKLLAYEQLIINDKNHNWYFKYISLFEKSKNTYDLAFLKLSFAAVNMCFTQKDYDQILKICQHVIPKYPENGNLFKEIIPFIYWSAKIFYKYDDISSAKIAAQQGFELISKYSIKATQLLDSSYLESIKNELNRILILGREKESVLTTKKYGRNELVKVQYQDGTITTKKYKKIQLDIENNKCLIIS